MTEIRLYSRPGCPLCDKVRAVLDREKVVYREVDISGDDELTKAYGWSIPVVTVDGEELFEAGMDPDELPELLDQA